jgi:tetratricopeptide (TPR) repeat protein
MKIVPSQLVESYRFWEMAIQWAQDRLQHEHVIARVMARGVDPRWCNPGTFELRGPIVGLPLIMRDSMSMNTVDEEWESRVAALWKHAESMQPDDLVRAADALADERQIDDAAALFERACARDTAGIESEAETYYRAALATGRLDPYRSSRASIQLASTLRILGRLVESEQLLVEELERHAKAGNSRALHDEARATLALTYVAQGRATEAAGLALATLVPHLSRYHRSMSRNAAQLVAKTWS